MSGVGVNKDLRKLVADNVELSNYLYIMSQVNVKEGELQFVKGEKFPGRTSKEKGVSFENITYVPEDEDPKDSFQRMKEVLLKETACFLIYNFYYGHGNRSAKFFLIRWVDDDNAKVKEKMMYASSTNGVKAKFPNLASSVVQCCDASEVTYEKFLELCKVN